MRPKFFSDSSKLRKWFETNHSKKDEQWIGYYKVNSGRKSITWPESVDQALCFGWIDGIRRSIDDEAYMIRFTPRRPKSNWSEVNLKRMPELIKLGLVHSAGMAAYERRDAEKIKQYAYERKSFQLTREQTAQIRRNKKAWAFFENLPPSVKKPTIAWVVTAKREETRKRRLAMLIECCQQEERLPHFQQPSQKKALRKKK